MSKYNVELSGTLTFAGLSKQISLSAGGQENLMRKITLLAGLAGTLSTRTDDNTGVVTLGSGHVVTAENTVSLYWSGGKRTGMTVTIPGDPASETQIAIDGGVGDNLPAGSTALVVGVETDVDFVVDGDTVDGILAFFGGSPAPTTGRCSAAFRTSGAAVKEFELNMTEGKSSYWWVGAMQVDNPLASSSIVTVRASNGTEAERELEIWAISQ